MTLRKSLEAQIQQQYDRLAAHYDHRWHHYLDESLHILQAWSDIHASDRVLDLACGTGEFAYRLLSQYPELRLTGIDLSPKMLAVAINKCQTFPEAHFQCANIQQLPFPDACFDRIVTSSAFHYFPEPVNALTEMKRVLDPAGKLIIVDWCKDYWLCQIYDWVLPWVDPAYRGCYTRAELRELIEKAQLKLHYLERIRPDWAWEFMVAVVSLN
ncbi:class I SAM-dependent methyltransferase [Synechococcus sp. PCC 6312]|uniref:class I SAM-dependent methyltransferase n=1 Tax=Synechococcus sp. (strain ATCC 27167 / PCC 6312) TaxID=195253 RepID=UPI00029EDDDC|nr:methyltransferase domain-containing protein [Synechococcus sp. PCC 6312]AFY61045.1 methylase involved in ubiquinone/menaquinone biosynthesis [Synechococcus sp. PCC 6312]